jgi:hypothetical protein
MRTTLRYGMEPFAQAFSTASTREPFLRAILSPSAGDDGMAFVAGADALHAGLQTYYHGGSIHGGGHNDRRRVFKAALAGRDLFSAVKSCESSSRTAVIGEPLPRFALEVRADIVVTNTDPGNLGPSRRAAA